MSIRRDIAPRVVHESIMPGNVNITPSYRAGDLDRNRAADHLAWARGHGYIGEEEYQNRVTAVQACATQVELRKLMTDLPAPEAPPGKAVKPSSAYRARKWLARNWGNPRLYVPVHLASMIVSAVIGIVPATLMWYRNVSVTAGEMASGAFFITVGFIFMMASIVSLICKSD